jgi:hypothetical protein
MRCVSFYFETAEAIAFLGTLCRRAAIPTRPSSCCAADAVAPTGPPFLALEHSAQLVPSAMPDWEGAPATATIDGEIAARQPCSVPPCRALFFLGEARSAVRPPQQPPYQGGHNGRELGHGTFCGIWGESFLIKLTRFAC